MLFLFGTKQRVRRNELTLYLIETPLNALQTEQTKIRQLLQELPDQGLLCLHMEKYDISDHTLVDVTSNSVVLCINMKVCLYNYS